MADCRKRCAWKNNVKMIDTKLDGETDMPQGWHECTLRFWRVRRYVQRADKHADKQNKSVWQREACCLDAGKMLRYLQVRRYMLCADNTERVRVTSGHATKCQSLKHECSREDLPFCLVHRRWRICQDRNIYAATRRKEHISK